MSRLVIGRPIILRPEVPAVAAAEPSNGARVRCLLFLNVASFMAPRAFGGLRRIDVVVRGENHGGRHFNVPKRQGVKNRVMAIRPAINRAGSSARSAARLSSGYPTIGCTSSDDRVINRTATRR